MKIVHGPGNVVLHSSLVRVLLLNTNDPLGGHQVRKCLFYFRFHMFFKTY
jgi:hypothetical protein